MLGFVGVSNNDTVAEGRKYQQVRGPLPAGQRRQRPDLGRLGVPYQPVTVVVDRRGRVARRFDGGVEPGKLVPVLRYLLAALDGGSGPLEAYPGAVAGGLAPGLEAGAGRGLPARSRPLSAAGRPSTATSTCWAWSPGRWSGASSGSSRPASTIPAWSARRPGRAGAEPGHRGRGRDPPRRPPFELHMSTGPSPQTHLGGPAAADPTCCSTSPSAAGPGWPWPGPTRSRCSPSRRRPGCWSGPRPRLRWASRHGSFAYQVLTACGPGATWRTTSSGPRSRAAAGPGPAPTRAWLPRPPPGLSPWSTRPWPPSWNTPMQGRRRPGRRRPVRGHRPRAVREVPG